MDITDLLRAHGDKIRQDPASGCWLWTAAVDDDGYGVMAPLAKEGGGTTANRPHVAAFDLANPRTRRYRDDVVMHRCNVRRCCCPAHLFLGSKSDNALHSVASGLHANAAKTHCPRGHPYDAANTLVVRGGGRYCRECARARSAGRRAAGR